MVQYEAPFNSKYICKFQYCTFQSLQPICIKKKTRRTITVKEEKKRCFYQPPFPLFFFLAPTFFPHLIKQKKGKGEKGRI